MIKYEIKDSIPSYFEKEKTGNHSIILLNEWTALGNRIVRFELRPGEIVSGGPRAELKGPRTLKNSEWWMGMAIKYPADYFNNLMAGSRWTINWQWHSAPDSNEPWLPPVSSLNVENGKFRIWSRYDTHSMSSSMSLITRPPFDFNSPIVNQRYCVTVHQKHYADNRGLLKIWLDGVLIVNIVNEPVTTNDNIGPFFKFGIYAATDKPKPLSCEISDLILMDGSDRFSQVDVLEREKQILPPPPPVQEIPPHPTDIMPVYNEYVGKWVYQYDSFYNNYKWVYNYEKV